MQRTVHFYVSIVGQQQGLISKNCSSEISIGGPCHPDHLNEIKTLVYAERGPKEGSGSTMFTETFVITKHLDRSTPLLLEALEDRETIDCEIAKKKAPPRDLNLLPIL
jgi:uncharacterized protein